MQYPVTTVALQRYRHGCALLSGNHTAKAIECYAAAIALSPGYAHAYVGLGIAFSKTGEFAQALVQYDKAAALDPYLAEAHYNKALVLLLLGDFTQGWQLYEWRWRVPAFTSPRRCFTQPLWHGNESLDGKTVLLHSEQGLGDTVQFSRYASAVASLGAKVVLELPSSLRQLLSRVQGVAQCALRGEALPAFDYHCPLMSLPAAFDTVLESIPSAAGYLPAPASAARHWRTRLAQTHRPRVGLVWKTNPANPASAQRDVALPTLLQWLPSEINYVSLQYGASSEEVHTLERHGILHFNADIADFADTAALCSLMDVVVSVDTSAAHVSAALGVPTWILVSHLPDFRWMLERTDSPWYTSAKLYRQNSPGSWSSALACLASDLEQLKS